MRVLIDATALPANRGGVGRYVDEVVTRLPALGVDTHVAAQPRDLERYAGALGRDHVHLSPAWADRPAVRLAWEQTGLPWLVRTVRPDVLHSPHYTLPLVSAVRRQLRHVVTLHDATFFSDPDLHLGVKARFFRTWTGISVRLADALIVPSEATEGEVLRYTHTDPARFSVIPHGVDHDRFRPPTPARSPSCARGSGSPRNSVYVAFLGTLEPRKNVPALVRAFAQAFGDAADPPVLVLAGGGRLGRRHRPGARGGARPADRPPTGVRARRAGPGAPRRRGRRRLPRVRRGVRAPGARGDGVRGRGPHDRPALALGGRRRRGPVCTEPGRRRPRRRADRAAVRPGRAAAPRGGRTRAGRPRYTWDATARLHAQVYESVVAR